MEKANELFRMGGESDRNTLGMQTADEEQIQSSTTGSEVDPPNYSGNYLALIVGMGDYNNDGDDIDTDIHDAPWSDNTIQLWKNFLNERPWWDYRVLFNLNASYNNIKNYTMELKLSEDDPSDRVLFVWTGHGGVDEFKESYIHLGDYRSPKTRKVNASKLRSWFNYDKNWDSHHTLQVFDTCHAGGMKSLADHNGSYVAMSSKKTQLSHYFQYGDEKTECYGNFTYYFLKGDEEAGKGLMGGQSVDDTFDYAYQNVGGQTPVKETRNWSENFFVSRHNLAITGVDAPSSVMQGEMATISVTVKNQGSYSESTTLTLVDTYTGQTVGSKSVSLAAGESHTYTFEWDTSGEPIAEHTLKAKVVPVEGETETADNTETVTIWVYYQRW